MRDRKKNKEKGKEERGNQKLNLINKNNHL